MNGKWREKVLLSVLYVVNLSRAGATYGMLVNDTPSCRFPSPLFHLLRGVVLQLSRSRLEEQRGLRRSGRGWRRGR